MTPRLELFTTIKTKLKEIASLELIDLDKGQFNRDAEFYSAALIKITNINWESMVEQRYEGQTQVEITIFTKDGFTHQHDTTSDETDGLDEIHLIDDVIEKLELLQGEQFKPLRLANEADNDLSDVIFSYKLTFETTIYKKIKTRYQTLNSL